YAGSGWLVAYKLHYISEDIPISGTGSMYPTFPKGTGTNPQQLAHEVVKVTSMFPYPNGLEWFGKRYFNTEIRRKDIVVFTNNKVRQITEKVTGVSTGMVKRVVGLPGDRLEIRGGLLYVNQVPLDEPYIARARSTFGGDFLRECKSVLVPPHKLLVMGDNRKGSSDSRHELGFIDLNDVDHVLPFDKQRGVLDKNWRNTAQDLLDSSKITLDRQQYLKLLNERRKKAGIPALRYEPKLEASAQSRGKIILQYDDFSFEATRSGYTMRKAIQEAGYSNIALGEAPIQGYYEAEELLENQLEFADTKKFLLNREYQDVGIAEVEGAINGCPTQIIVQHFAGYIPPNYDRKMIASWEKALTSLKEIQPGWLKVKENTKFYEKNKSDIDRLNDIIAIRIDRISAIVMEMHHNKWLTNTEEDQLKGDETLGKEQEALSMKLNNR
ncbi:signal peptidase I, partial [Candidatus Roizmanbacteria bacterium]|nr:signal peptidase I [Candidatus Roizmanbacteria bacterium]